MTERNGRTDAQKRYDKKCPVVSVRLTPRLKPILDKFKRKNESYPDAIIRCIELMEKRNEWDAECEKTINEAIELGKEVSELDYKITYPCSICGKDVIMHPGGNSHIAVQKYLKEQGWGHTACHEKTD